MLYRQLVPGTVGTSEAASAEQMPKKQVAAQTVLMLVIRTLSRCAQEVVVLSPHGHL
jgi:hypothetical protein